MSNISDLSVKAEREHANKAGRPRMNKEAEK